MADDPYYGDLDANISEKHTASIFRTENGDSMLLQITGMHLLDYTASWPRR
jgi:hypothetical protein